MAARKKYEKVRGIFHNVDNIFQADNILKTAYQIMTNFDAAFVIEIVRVYVLLRK